MFLLDNLSRLRIIVKFLNWKANMPNLGELPQYPFCKSHLNHILSFHTLLSVNNTSGSFNLRHGASIRNIFETSISNNNSHRSWVSEDGDGHTINNTQTGEIELIDGGCSLTTKTAAL